MSKKIKLKDLLNENFSGTMLGGVVSRNPFHDNLSLSKVVKEKYGDVDGQKIDIKGLNQALTDYNKLGEEIFGKSNITQISEKLNATVLKPIYLPATAIAQIALDMPNHKSPPKPFYPNIKFDPMKRNFNTLPKS